MHHFGAFYPSGYKLSFLQKVPMDEDHTQTQTGIRGTAQPPWDLDKMVDQVSIRLRGVVDALTIRRTLIDILSRYEEVPIRTFVPVLACREAIKVLKK
jgi:hypothetical protein